MRAQTLNPQRSVVSFAVYAQSMSRVAGGNSVPQDALQATDLV